MRSTRCTCRSSSLATSSRAATTMTPRRRVRACGRMLSGARWRSHCACARSDGRPQRLRCQAGQHLLRALRGGNCGLGHRQEIRSGMCQIHARVHTGCADERCSFQEFHDNMAVIEPPVITSAGGAEDYTKVTFYPDLPRFGMEVSAPVACTSPRIALTLVWCGQCLDRDTMALLTKRVYDVAGTTDRTVRVRARIARRSSSARRDAPPAGVLERQAHRRRVL